VGGGVVLYTHGSPVCEGDSFATDLCRLVWVGGGLPESYRLVIWILAAQPAGIQ
jgi:hypothetical protein